MSLKKSQKIGVGFLNNCKIYSRLLRFTTARGSCTGLVTVGPTKPYKSAIFNMLYKRFGGNICNCGMHVPTLKLV